MKKRILGKTGFEITELCLGTWKFTSTTTFNPHDHRAFNRLGEAFDKGETFSGIDYLKG